MKRERKTNLKSLLLVLLITLIMLVASSYAWFTANQTVTINQLNVNVQTTTGLQISVDAANWKSVITTTDLVDATVAAAYPTHTNQIPTTMEPVSSAGLVTSGRLDIYYGVVDANETSGEFEITATKEVDTRGTAGRYIAFDIFLQVNTDTIVGLTTSSSVVAVAASKGLENAARVAFLTQGHEEIGSAPSAAQALNAGTTSDLFLWEPNSDVHTSAGVQNAASVYGITGLGLANEDPLEYVGIRAPFTTGIPITATAAATSYFATVTPTLSTPKTMTVDEEFATLEEGITKIRVYMWVEGEDVDCENNASGTDIGYNIQFTILGYPDPVGP